MSNSIDLRLEVKDRKLLIYYHPNNEYVLYDVCDLNGNILFSGKMSGEYPVVGNIEKLCEGSYQLCIIDGEDLIKKTFKL